MPTERQRRGAPKDEGLAPNTRCHCGTVLNDCPYYYCDVNEWNTGNTTGVSFWYLCPACGEVPFDDKKGGNYFPVYATPAAAFDKARCMTRQAHTAWMVWQGRGGSYSLRVSADAIKAALLATGTQGHFYVFTPGPRQHYPMQTGWRVGLNMLRIAQGKRPSK